MFLGIAGKEVKLNSRNIGAEDSQIVKEQGFVESQKGFDGVAAIQRIEVLERLAADATGNEPNDPFATLASCALPRPQRNSQDTVAFGWIPPVKEPEFPIAPEKEHLPDNDSSARHRRLELEPSRQNERFKILRSHAKGGLGEVFLAEDFELQREVALKTIRPEFSGDPGARERFLLEATVTGGLEHPGIVPVYALGKDETGNPYYVMRFIQGENLADGIDQFYAEHGTPVSTTSGDRNQPRLRLSTAAIQSRPFRQLLQQFINVCNTIGYAHARGVLHRDLKPGNVMLGKFGETLVVDWGLAKRKPMPGDSPDSGRPLSGQATDWATQVGTAMGSPAYLSPEQAAGRTDLFSPATDIYLLGATLYHLITGQAPHHAGSREILFRQVAAGKFPRPREINKSIPPSLEAVCLKAMALNRLDRYESAMELAADLERYLADEPVRARRESVLDRAKRLARRYRTVVLSIGAAAVLVAMVACATGWVINQQRIAAVALATKNKELASANKLEANRATAAVQRNQVLLRQASMAQFASARKAWDEYETAKFRGQIAIGLPGASKGHEAIAYLVRSLELDAENHLAANYLYHVLAQRLPHPRRILRANSPIVDVRFSADGSRVLTLGEHNVASWDWASGRSLGANGLTYTPKEVIGINSDFTTLVWKGESAPQSAQLRDFATGKTIGQPLSHAASITNCEFTPDGILIVTADESGSAQLWDARTGRPLGPIMRHQARINRVRFSADGKLLLTSSDDRSVRLWTVPGGLPVGESREHPGPVLDAEFCPVGSTHSHAPQHQAKDKPHFFVTRCECSTDSETADPNRHVELRFWSTSDLRPQGSPVHCQANCELQYSADGSRLMLTRERTKGTDWRTIEAQVFDVSTGLPVGPAIPCCRSIYHRISQFNRDGGRLITLDGGAVIQVDVCTGTVVGRSRPLAVRVTSTDLSPDGGSLLLVSEQQGAWQYSLATDHFLGDPLLHIGQVTAARFSKDGKSIITTGFDGHARVWIASACCHQQTTRSHCTVRRFIRSRIPHLEESSLVEVSPDRQSAVTWEPADFTAPHKSGTARLWRLSASRPEARPLDHPNGISAVAFSFDSTSIAIAGGDNQVRILKVPTIEQVCPTLVHDGADRVVSLEFSPTGDHLTTVGDDYSVILWNPRTGERINSIYEVGQKEQLFELAHRGVFNSPVTSAFNSQGTVLAFITADSQVRMCKIPSGEPCAPTLRHDQVLRVAFSDDGSRIVTASINGTVHVWDSATGIPLGPAIRPFGKTVSSELDEQPPSRTDVIRRLSLRSDRIYISTGFDEVEIDCTSPERTKLPGKAVLELAARWSGLVEDEKGELRAVPSGTTVVFHDGDPPSDAVWRNLISAPTGR